MSITVLRNSSTIAGLVDQGTPAHPGSGPLCRFSGIDVAPAGAGDNDNGSGCGIWQCTPGAFQRQLAQAEVMHILCGRGVFTPTVGDPVAFAAGDTLFFDANTTGEWSIEETVRKVFVVLAG